MNLKLYIRNFPITTIIIVMNFIIFILNQFGFLSYSISQPGVLNIGTFLAHFSHATLLHFAMNMLVCAQISPFLERQLSKPKYISVIISIWLLLTALTFPFSQNPTLGFSGIIMGLLMFTILFYRKNHQFAKTLLSWLVINIAIGFLPQISLLGHFMGAIAGAMVFVGYWGIQKIKNI